MRNLLFVIFLLPFISLSQKKELDHTVFNDWKKVERSIISNNGNYIVYEINPHQGDGFLYIHNVATGKTDSFPRAKEAQISYENKFVAFKISPGFDTLRKCELDKVDKKKWPKDTLGIFLFEKDTLIKVAKLKSFKLAEESELLTYLLDDNKLESAAPAKKKKNRKKKKKEPEVKEYKSDGTILTFFDPNSLKTFKIKDVSDYAVSKKGNSIAVVTHKKEKSDSFYLTIYKSPKEIVDSFPARSAYRQLSFSPDGTLLAFVHSADTTKSKRFQLDLYNATDKTRKSIADTTSGLLAQGKATSEHYQPLFTEDGRFLYFGVADLVEPEKKDTLLETEKPKVDVWHYLDDRIQSQQLKELKRDEKKTDLFVYHLANGNVIGLSNDTLSVRAQKELKGNYLFGGSEEAYKLNNQWDVPDREDHYRINVLTGKVELLKKEIRMDGQLSPSGRYYTWFNHLKNQFFILDAETGIEQCMTCSVGGVNWQEDVNGMPMLASPFGVIGYVPGETSIMIQAEYDIYNYQIATNAVSCLTNGEGELRKIRLTSNKWNSDSVYYSPSSFYVRGFDETTKGSYIFSLEEHGDHVDMKQLYYSDHKIVQVTKAKQNDKVLLRKMSLKDYPEVRLTTTTFSEEKILSKTNPQQDSFNWATVELIKWKSYNGIPLEGLVYKPENFDPTQKYPMLVYYYELYADDFHNHYVPKPSASIIHPTEYASAGYIVFIPDVRYKAGYPAKSAYDCIMSGTDHVLKIVPAIDSKRMGLQGQSWGGYQTAQLITMTDRYAAAMAGAPVSNMFSAYGGIRWGSGVNRQFQYEKTQSRIGKTIWEAPELYTENSPLFHLPKVKTPLLIMHNDEDGAVPWYQSIELYTGMRRLGKPCWMLNYNGDDHNLMKNANRIDLSIRMKQFFDHYLMDKPAPQWLSEGIPAVDKGKELGY
jgi:dipeptidyl aminopeptidase/acylaminoacyl peptidase